jgi:magnesium-transporting ATPase (P-type)
MMTSKKRTNVAVSLLVLFLATFITGFTLHLKKHGIVVEPRPLIKLSHWMIGVLMGLFALCHANSFWKIFVARRRSSPLFWIDTTIVAIFVTTTVVTGLIKLLSPVKIPHLSMWHYYSGMAMAAVIVVHLICIILIKKRIAKC